MSRMNNKKTPQNKKKRNREGKELGCGGKPKKVDDTRGPEPGKGGGESGSF